MFIRRRFLAAGSIAFLAAVAFLLSAPKSAGADPCGECPPSPVLNTAAATQSSAAQELVAKHAPIVYIRNQEGECDRRGSPYVPAPVEFLFGQDDIVLYRHESGENVEVKRNIQASDLYGLDDTYFIDSPGDPKRPGCTFERDFLARFGAYEPTVYAHIVSEEGRDGIALQYWFYYYFNDWNNTHEGDWEMIQLSFDGPTVEDALSQTPRSGGYSQHSGGERANWGDSKWEFEGDRPVAHAAAGANANQFEANIILGRGDNGTGFGCDDASRPSRRVDLRAILVEEPTGPDDKFAWLGFDGRWGERAPWEFNGPTGPNDKLAWTRPFTWQDRLRPSSIIVPSRNTLGPNAVNFFCDAVWYLSSPFSVLVRMPRWVLFAGFGMVLGAAGYTLTRTRYRPIIDWPLRRRRRLGQMLSAATRVYRRNFITFLGIGALYVPMAIVAVGVQWLLSQPSYIDTASHFFTRSVAAELVIALTIGSVTSSTVYWFVYSAAVAAVGRIERGERADVLSVERHVLSYLRPLAVARIKSLAIILGLAVTVIGTPWAIRQAVRWAFIEEAILLDQTSRADAPNVSARAVSGRWPYSAACLAVLGLIGVALGPTLAFVLMFTTGLSVALVNFASSFVYVAVVPLVAVAQSMLYYTLTTREDESSETDA